MGEWSDYFEDFPEENPANEKLKAAGPVLRARLEKNSTSSPDVAARMAEDKAVQENRSHTVLVEVRTKRTNLGR